MQVNEERAAEGIDHLQRAAREMVAAARSFLDVVEELVEDRAALADVAAAVSGAAAAVGDVVRTGLGSRAAPWEAAAWGDPPFEDDHTGADAASADEPVADLRDRATEAVPEPGPSTGPDRPSRVRRIAVD